MALPKVPVGELLLTVISVTLLAILLFIFWSEWRRTRARFSLGLMLFAGVFLVKEALRVLQVIGSADGVPLIGRGIAFLVALAEVIALSVLLYLVSR